MRKSGAELQLDNLSELDQKLINVLNKSAEILDSINSLSTPSQAQSLVNQKPEEFSNLLKSIREEFFHVIENAPKPGIPYYDPKPLSDQLRNSNNSMKD